MGDQDTALDSVIILNAWTTSATLCFSTASAMISGQVYEAAAIDGANAGRHQRSPAVARPAATSWRPSRSSGRSTVRPGGDHGGPPVTSNALMTVLYLYNAAFSQFKFGYAAAVGVILFIVI